MGIASYKAFTIGNSTRNIAFKVNGYTVSMGIAYGHYCENRDNRQAGGDWKPCDKTSDNCEIGIFDPSGEWVTKEIWKEVFKETLYDDVEGFVSMAEVVQLLNHLSQKGVK